MFQGVRTITAYALALLLLATLVSHSWSAPKGSFQRRNWSPQAMLYLKGTRMSTTYISLIILCIPLTYLLNVFLHVCPPQRIIANNMLEISCFYGTTIMIFNVKRLTLSFKSEVVLLFPHYVCLFMNATKIYCIS